MAQLTERIPLAPPATIKVILGEQILSEPPAVATAQPTERILLALRGIIKVTLGALTPLVQPEAVTAHAAAPIHLALPAVTEYALLNLKAFDIPSTLRCATCLDLPVN